MLYELCVLQLCNFICMNDSNYFFTQEVDIQSGGKKPRTLDKSCKRASQLQIDEIQLLNYRQIT